MSKQTKTWLLIAIASFLGWIGISKFGKFQQEYSVQQQALAQAQQLVNEADNINNNSDLNSLKVNQTKLQQTIAILEKIPNLPGLPYQKAQKDLAELRTRLAKVESKLTIEEQALANLQAALKLDKELNNYMEIAAAYLGKLPQECHIIFSALSQAGEDVGTVEYLRSLCQYNSAYCPIESITMDDQQVYDHLDRKIDIIYRLYPTEWMVEDKDPNLGMSLWDYLEPLIYARKVALINPLSSFVIQNKALMALITELGLDTFHKDGVTGYSHFLPTFMDQSKISYPFVAKPTWGREGKEVEIYKQSGEVINNPSSEYSHLYKIYQQYVDMPLIEVQDETYTLQLSCFLINGIPEGVGARIGKDLITNTSKFLPIGY